MSNTDGLLINNNNIYGLVNPPPVPDAKDKAKAYQDPSSAAVRWDHFADLSNNGFSFNQASHTFKSVVEEIPYATQGYAPTNNIYYPLYQQNQIIFTQNKTFSKIRLYLEGREGAITGLSSNLSTQLPNANMINNDPNDANWAAADISQNPPLAPPIGNRDGWWNDLIGPAGSPWNFTNGTTGIVEAQTATNNDGFDVYDISGPTKVADLNNTGEGFVLYENININGWNLSFYVVITETAPDGTTKFLAENCEWTSGTTTEGIKFHYNPQAVAVIRATDHQQVTAPPYFFFSPELTKNESTSAQNANYNTVRYGNWYNSPTFTNYGHLIHSMRSKLQGDNLFYIEKDLGTQIKLPTPMPPGFPTGLQAWQNKPVVFKKDHSYLVNISMVNTEITLPKSSIAPGPGLCQLDAVTYLELIV